MTDRHLSSNLRNCTKIKKLNQVRIDLTKILAWKNIGMFYSSLIPRLKSLGT